MFPNIAKVYFLTVWPIADIALFDHLDGAAQHGRRHRKTLIQSPRPELQKHQQVHGGKADAGDANGADPDNHHVAKIRTADNGDDRHHQRDLGAACIDEEWQHCVQHYAHHRVRNPQDRAFPASKDLLGVVTAASSALAFWDLEVGVHKEPVLIVGRLCRIEKAEGGERIERYNVDDLGQQYGDHPESQQAPR